MSGTAVHTYAPDQVLVLVGGVPLSGFAEDGFVEIEPMSDLVTSSVGADGEVARSINTDKRNTVSITLQQVSPSNDYLSTLIEVDALTGGVLIPLTVQDLRGRSLYVASQAWISKRPTVTYGRESGDRVWVFETGGPSVSFVGGNV